MYLYVRRVTSFSFRLYSVNLFSTLIAGLRTASLCITVSYNDFSAMFMEPIIMTAHLSLLYSVSLSLNYIFTVCHSKQGVLKLLIIIPGHELVGRLGGGHIAAKVLQCTMWTELTEPRPQGNWEPQKEKDNGKWRVRGREGASRLKRLTCLTDCQKPGGTPFITVESVPLCSNIKPLNKVFTFLFLKLKSKDIKLKKHLLAKEFCMWEIFKLT